MQDTHFKIDDTDTNTCIRCCSRICVHKDTGAKGKNQLQYYIYIICIGTYIYFLQNKFAHFQKTIEILQVALQDIQNELRKLRTLYYILPNG